MTRLASLAALAALTGFPAAPVAAQTSLFLCRVFKDDAARLSCYDTAFEAFRSAIAAQTQPRDPDWSLHESQSPIDDSPQIMATILATLGPASLILRCKERSTEAIYSPDAYLGSSSPIRVLYRINSGKALEGRWRPSSSGKAAFAPAAVAFIKSLPDNGSLFLRATTYSGATHDATFTLKNVGAMRQRIAATCHWPAGHKVD